VEKTVDWDWEVLARRTVPDRLLEDEMVKTSCQSECRLQMKAEVASHAVRLVRGTGLVRGSDLQGTVL
jgi:hypothetical protein